MGGSTSKDFQTEDLDAQMFFTKREYDFIILETEVVEAINTHNREHLRHIKSELHALFKTLQLLQMEKKWTKTSNDRCERLLYNYELTLAKVVSALNSISQMEKVETVEDKDFIVYEDNEENQISSQADNGISKEEQEQPSTSTKAENYFSQLSIHEEQSVSTDDNTRYAEISRALDGDKNPFRIKDPTEGISRNRNTTQEAIDFLTDFESSLLEDVPVYANMDDIQPKHSPPSSSSYRYKSFRKIKKPPVPIPRNHQDVVVKDIPKYFTRLNDIYEKDVLTEDDVQEVYLIRRRCNEVKDMFVEKADKIFEKYDSQKLVDKPELSNSDNNDYL